MRNLFRVALGLSLVAAVASCGILQKIRGEDPDAEAAADAETSPVEDAAATEPPEHTPLAANEDDIARFPDEAALDAVAATVQRTGSVREAPVTGAIVASLARNATVLQLAQREKYFLVVFDNPSEPSQKLMGWLHQDAFGASAPAVTPPKKLSCKAPEMPLFGDAAFCGRSCAVDTDCPSGQACKGSANKLTKDGKAGDAVTVCTVHQPHDAGAPSKPAVVKDGGGGGGGLGALEIPGLKNLLTDAGIVKTDAGAAKADAGAAKADAGAKPAATDLDVVAPAGGKCPAGFKLIDKDKKCHRICNFDCKQKETQACVKCGDVKVCTADRNICK
jgi:hypothetical protein